MSHGSPLSSLAAHQASNRIASAGGDGTLKLWNAADFKMLFELKGDLDVDHRKTTATQARDVAKRLADLRKKQVGEREKAWNDLNARAKEDAAKVAAALKDLAAKESAAVTKRSAADQAAAQVSVLESVKDPGLGKAKEPAKKMNDEANKAASELVTAERNLRNAERTRDLAIKDGTKAGERFLAAQTAAAEADARLAAAEEALKAIEGEAAQAGAGAISSLAFSPNGKSLAVSAEKVGLRLWSTATGHPLDVIHREQTALVTFHPQGEVLAALPTKRILRWQTPIKWSLARTIGAPDKPEPFVDRVLSLAFHPRGHLLAAGSGIPSRDGALSFWNVSDGSLVGKVEKAHLDTITGLAFSPNGQLIASSSTDRYLKIHNVETRELVDQLEGHTNHVLDVAWSADGETLASAGADHAAKLWAVESSKQKKTEAGFKKELTSVAFLGTGEGIVMGGGDKVIKANGQNLSGVDDFVYDLAASSDGSRIIAGGENGVLRVWNAADRKLLYSFAPPSKPSTETASK